MSNRVRKYKIWFIIFAVLMLTAPVVTLLVTNKDYGYYIIAACYGAALAMVTMMNRVDKEDNNQENKDK
jgi:hypothetical protein